MPPMDVIKPISVARTKTEKVRSEVQAAQAELSAANDVLAESAQGLNVARKDVEAALEQNQQVEERLQDAVQELKVVTGLLKVAEAEKVQRGEDAGKRSGEGAESALEHLRAALNQPAKP
ncbi:MAG: hypothetical protein EOO25_03650 [Comamonadaceae bacterium]|nr:MAG: hypothetical protein EOO25_03650 [Comamonadaceae bacterium]